jgi:serine/threonine protein kinase
MVAGEEPTSLRSVRPDVPVELEAVVMRCLAKNPDQRIPDVGVLAQQLEPFAPPECKPLIERIVRVVQGVANPTSRRRGTGRTIPNPGDATPASTSTSKTARAEGTVPKRPNVALVVAVLVAVVGIALLAMRALAH